MLFFAHQQILILDFNTFLNMSGPDHEKCVALIDELADYTVPDIGPTATFNDIWATEVCTWADGLCISIFLY
jgi:hypothetical protein